VSFAAIILRDASQRVIIVVFC